MTITTWGDWQFNTSNACLEYTDPHTRQMIYQVPVDEMDTSARILDWIFQIEEKTWADRTVVGDFVTATRSILGRHVAGSGIDSPIDPKRILTAKYGITF